MNVLTLVGWKARLVRTALASLIWVLSLSGCGDKQAEEEINVGEAGISGSEIPADTPPILRTVPPFSLTNQDGFSIDNSRLSGRVWLASFIFTRCPATCSRLTGAFAQLQKTFKQDPAFEAGRLVSFSVDPEHDTPEVLHQYARNFDADPMLWTFLTGDRVSIWSLAKEGFKLAVSENPHAEMVIAHSQHFVLVDRRGRIRGYYDGLDETAIEQLKHDFLAVKDDPGWPLPESEEPSSG